MAKFFLRKKISDRIAHGHPWVFANELGDSVGNYAIGDIVEVYSYNGSFVGKGYINPNSNIRIRLLTRNNEEHIDQVFFDKRIKQAANYRIQLQYSQNYRVIHGEADLLPGLIVDKYGDILVAQILTYGMECRKEMILNSLQEVLSPKAIYERNDINSRKIETLPLYKGFIKGSTNTALQIKENELSFWVDIENGERTGYFLDQHMNRTAINKVVKGASVLDAFTNTGSFSIHAAYYGAKNVLGLDISTVAVNMSIKNAAQNNLDHICRFEQANAFDALREKVNSNEKYDVVMLNPPSFAGSRQKIDNALNGYKEINRRGMQLLRSGGFLITSSCTNLITQDMFKNTILEAAKDCRRQVKEIYYNTQSPDHPIVWHIPTTQYLKFYILQVI